MLVHWWVKSWVGEGGGRGVIYCFLHLLDYLDQFKAIKENLLKGVGHLDPLRTPTHLRLSQKPKFVVLVFFKPSLKKNLVYKNVWSKKVGELNFKNVLFLCFSSAMFPYLFIWHSVKNKTLCVQRGVNLCKVKMCLEHLMFHLKKNSLTFSRKLLRLEKCFKSQTI